MGLLNGRRQKYLHKMKEVFKKFFKKKGVMGNRYSKGKVCYILLFAESCNMCHFLVNIPQRSNVIIL